MKDKQDLTTGSVPRKLIAFALPLLLANLLQSFYSIVDMLQGSGQKRTCRGEQCVHDWLYHQLCVYRHYHGRHGGGCPI